MTTALALCWLVVSLTMPAPKHLSSRLIRVPAGEDQSKDLTERLLAIPGVAEAVVPAEEGVAYLKVDSHTLDEDTLTGFESSQ